MLIKLKKLDENAIEPVRGTEDAACLDLYALEDTEFEPGEIKLVRTGWAAEVPKGWRINIYVRSSTPLKKKFILANSIGVVDNDYRGELMVQLMNVKTKTVPAYNQEEGLSMRNRNEDVAVFTHNKISRGDKIAQLEIVLDAHKLFTVAIVNELSSTNRGAGGFGSTGN
jgi:dUTP pyrophosphatase